MTWDVKDASKTIAGTVDKLNSDVMELSANMEQCSATAEAVSENIYTIAGQTSDLAAQVAEVNIFVTEESSSLSLPLGDTCCNVVGDLVCFVAMNEIVKK